MEPAVIAIVALLSGYFLDLIFGDPDTLPHPIVYFGKWIAYADKLWNYGKYKLVKGLIVVLVLVGAVWTGVKFIQYCLAPYWALDLGFRIVLVFFALANTTLIREGRMVFQVLEKEGIIKGRIQLSRIVGRNVSDLKENKVKIAVLETMSENLNDGVIAPLFFYAIGGVPAMLAYKMVNTLDSMLGYKNDKYYYFGKSAAILDDIANFIPARITAFLIAVVNLSWRAMQFILVYGKQHASPNAGYPEAALAGVLNCRFGGPNTYGTVLLEKPFIGDHDKIISKKDLITTVRTNHKVTALFVLLTCLFLMW